MKSIRFYSFFIMAMLSGGISLFAQTNGFTYQGRLNIDGAPANGTYDLAFSLFGTNVTGVAVAGPVTNSSTSISNGLFTTLINLGPAMSSSSNNWLEIAVRTNGAGGFVMLTPRQQLTPTPYAITAGSLDGVARFNSISNTSSTVGGGLDNVAGSTYATVGGGLGNRVLNDYGTVAGGVGNATSNQFSSVGGGSLDNAFGYGATVGGGQNNEALNTYATISGGEENTASGFGSTIPGGQANVASGVYSFASGNNANAINDRCFVWNDGSSPYSSTANNQFRVHANGGIFLDGNITGTAGVTFSTDMHMGVSSADYRHFSIGGGNSYGYLYGSYPGLGDGIHMGYNFYYDTAGTGHVINSGGATSRVSTGYGDIQLATGNVNTAPTVRLEVTATTVTVKNATFNNSSDRNLKQDFSEISPRQILDQVLALPVSEWSYQFDPTTRHIGPMAQDFYSAFNIGTDDKHIAPMDEGGLAFAAIKGLNEKLNQKLEEKDSQIQKLAAEIEELKQAIKAR